VCSERDGRGDDDGLRVDRCYTAAPIDKQSHIRDEFPFSEFTSHAKE
jgi:hypothetical protein